MIHLKWWCNLYNDRYYELLLSLAGLKEILDSLSIPADMRSYIESIPNNKIKGKAIDWLQTNQSVSLSDLKAFVANLEPVQPMKAPDELTSGAPESLANWLRFHFDKLSKKNQKQYLELAELVPVIIRWYNENKPDINNYSLQDVLNEVGLMKANRPSSELDRFLFRVKEPLKSYLYSVLPGLKPEDMDIHPERVQNLMQEGRDAAEQGMAASIQNLMDWYEHARPRVSKYPRDASGFKQMLAEAEHWHRMQCELYPNNDYDPIDSKLIVYGPKWKNSEYDGNFVIELKSANDLKVEGKKMRHCVGNYVNAVKSGSSRIFSIRDRGNNPIITIETGPNMLAFRQAYGPGNSQPSGNNLEMVNEFQSILNRNIDLDKLSNDEKIELINSKNISQDILDKLSNDPDAIVRFYVASNSNTKPETLDKLSNDPDAIVRYYVASNSNTKPETLDKLSNDPDVDVRVAARKNLENRKLAQATQMTIIAANQNEQKIIEFKNYLKSLGKYSGDINSSEPDNDFISGIKLLENELSDAINNKSIIGLIWQGNKINPQTSVADVTAAIDILKKKGLLKSAQGRTSLDKSAQSRTSLNKSAQATVDTFDVDEYMDSPPSATKTVLTADETNIEHGDPANSQQIGKSVVELPKTASRDDRIIEFVKIFG